MAAAKIPEYNLTGFTRLELLAGVEFEVTERYFDVAPIGAGAFGVVCSAKDKITGRAVAIKKASRPFDNLIIAKRSCRELRLLKKFKHENVVFLFDVFLSPSEDIYFVTELLQTDLHHLLSAGPMEAKFCQYFFYQIMRALKYIHSSGVIHRDLKPANILINDNCDLKICDFGLARDEDGGNMTGYVATRYYRAPEVMLNWQQYSFAMDNWSAGCILAEMITGKPMFPGKDHIAQFVIITQILGSPPDEVLETITSQSALKFLQSLPRTEPQPLENVFVNASPETIDMLKCLLCLDPKKRWTAPQCLEHSFCAPYHDPKDEPIAKERFNWPLEFEDMDEDSMKMFIYSEILDFHGELDSATRGM